MRTPRAASSRPIAIIGPYPDYGGQVGGISVHIQRIVPYMREAGLDVRVYQIGGAGCPAEGVYSCRGRWGFLGPILRTERRSVVHSHLIGAHERVAQGLARYGRSGPMILTVHGRSLRDQIHQPRKVPGALVAWAARAMDHVVAVSAEVAGDVRQAGVAPERISTLPAYAPPRVTDAERARMPAELSAFVQTHDPVCCFMGAFIEYDGKDLYGHDLALEMLGRLRAEHPNAGLVISIGRAGDRSSIEQQVRARAAQPDVAGHVLFLPPGLPLCPVIEQSDVFVRPTRVDGWGVSVAEAIQLNVPAVASDVCQRVSGAYLFPNEDVAALTAQVRRALAEGVPAGAGSELDYHERLVALYRRLAQ